MVSVFYVGGEGFDDGLEVGVMYVKTSSVEEEKEATMGRPGLLSLWILGRK